ncbi:hypothetical protein [Gracilibacillus salinarum]|uniref:Uncharacterized protein n=1 Tax=Gracilibacillus salinarum TaxID=2932255 RepID=A0ABY4GP87_9BACI|nr:hypothetical protein [Gracilibacillus salinarum]UOQ86203.1 hypothetical protein MUN87_04710 [Gracilibacillus salinarum]
MTYDEQIQQLRTELGAIHVDLRRITHDLQAHWAESIRIRERLIALQAEVDSE